MILVTGGTGQVGTALRAILTDAAFPTRHDLDLSAPADVYRAVARLEPEAIINCAAYTAVDRAETDRRVANAVNAESVAVLAEFTARRGIPFVTISTDYVFDGDSEAPYVESSATAPINAYGESKRAGERAALEANPRALIVRTSWVFSSTHDGFVPMVLRRAAAGEARVVTDQRSVPTFADDLAAGLVAAMKAGASGILHLTNEGDATRFELAVEAVRIAGIDARRVIPVESTEFPDAAARPRYSVMRSERLASLGLTPLPPWRESLARAIGTPAGPLRSWAGPDDDMPPARNAN